MNTKQTRNSAIQLVLASFIKKFKKPKYEFYLFDGNQIMVDRDVKKMQEDGWELAGQVSTEFSDSGRMHRMLIPLKRKI